MNRKVALSAYQDFSAQASAKVRQLSFAALGVIWIFKPEANFEFSPLLLWAGLFAIGALAGDFLQSLYGTVAWGTLHRKKELQGIAIDEEFKAPKWINWPTNSFFAAKMAALVASYAFLFSFMLDVIRAP